MITIGISTLLSKDVKFPEIYEFNEDLFKEEKTLMETRIKQKELELHKERMRIFAKMFNESRKGS